MKANLNQLANLISDTGEESDRIEYIYLTDTEKLILILKRAQAFVYSKEMECWMRISDISQMNSEYFTQIPPKKLKNGILFDIQTRTNQLIEHLEPSSPIDINDTISQLENQIVCSEILGSNKEFKLWLECYVNKLTNEGKETKLYELCHQLLGTPSSVQQENGNGFKNKTEWNPFILDYEKRKLLEDIIYLIGKNKSLWGVVEQFTRDLENMKEESKILDLNQDT